jgi:hypothetical protein
MGFLNSFNPVNLASQVALTAATGGSSLILQTALRAVVSNIGQQLIQQLGSQFGVPQNVIDLAQGNFAGSVGDFEGASSNYQDVISEFVGQAGGSPLEEGQLRGSADELRDSMFRNAIDRLRNSGPEEARPGAGGRNGSVLMRIAIALGQLMDQKMDEMAGLADKIGDMGTIDNKNQSQLMELNARLQGLSQETNILGNAMTNSIKTIGESAATIARKG